MCTSQRISLFASIATISAGACTALAGDLDPPPGPVVSSMLRLDEIDSSTPIRTVPTTITLPGRYHLVSDLVVPDLMDGIIIDLQVDGHVEFDMRGHSLTAPPTAGAVIRIRPFPSGDITLKRGVINGGTNGILMEAPISFAATADRGASEWKYVNIRRFTITNTSGDGVHLAGDAEITLKFLQISNTGGHGISISTDVPRRVDIEDASVALTFGDGIHIVGGDALTVRNVALSGGANGITVTPSQTIETTRFQVQLEKVRLTSYSFDGLHVVAGLQSIQLVVEDSTFEDGAGTAILVEPSLQMNAQPISYLRYKLLRCWVSSWSTSAVIVPTDSGGTINDLTVEDTGATALVLGDNARLNEVQVWGAGADGINAGVYIALNNTIVENSMGSNIVLGGGAFINRSVSGHAGTRGIEVGDASEIIDTLVVGNTDALLGGRDVKVRGSTIKGAINLGQYASLQSSVFIVDLDEATFVPHNLTGGKHSVNDCEFDAHGTDINKIPFLNFSGDDVRIRNTKILAVDPQLVPVVSSNRSPPHYTTWDGRGYDFQNSGVYNIWSGAEGIMLVAGGSGHIIKGNSFTGDGGAGAIGMIGSTDNSLIVANNFTALGSSGVPISVSGLNNVIGAVVTGSPAVTNCSPDRNLWVP